MARASRPRRDDRRQSRSRQGGRRIGLRRLLGWSAFLPLASRAPMYGRLFWELVRDERTPAERKAVLAAAMGYVVLGRDLVPDDAPLIGGIDDLVVVMLALDLFLDGIPGELLEEKLEVLGIDRRAFDDDVARVRRFVPRPVRRLVRGIPGTLTVAGNALKRSGIGPRVRSWINKEGSIA